MRTFQRSNVLVALVCATALLAGCAGHSAAVVPGGGSDLADSRAGAPSSSSPSAGKAKTAGGKFVLRVPKPSGHRGRQPRYISAATRSISLQITDVKNGANDITPNPPPAAVVIDIPNATSSSPGAPCVNDPSNAGNYLCTIAITMYVGSDTVAINAYDASNGTGNVLSEQNAVEPVVAGVANSFAISLDANAATMVVSSSGSCSTGAVGSSFGGVGTSSQTFTVAYTDPAGKTIVGPGLPSLAILGNDSAYHTDSGTISATGGTVGFSINQSAQTITLTPSTASTTNATVSIKATPPNSSGASDGLSFALTQSFTFSTGAAPPAHNFLAGVEQGTGAGQIDLYDVSLGGSGGPDTFSAYTPATLAVTNSTNEGKPDVDNPQSLAWDSSGDLLIGNGGTGGADTGSLACVPPSAIGGGANTATTTSTSVDDPVGLALDTRDNDVALANNPISAAEQLAEYQLSGNYTALPASNDIAAGSYGAFSVAAIPAATAGTFAVALSTGTESDPAHGSGASKIAIKSPSGAETDITDTSTFAIDEPRSIAWDNQNAQLAIANFSSFHKLLSFYTAAGTQVTTLNTGRRNTQVAASPDGHIAVAGNDGLGYPLVQVYGNTAARNAVNGPIPFNGIDNANDCNNGVGYLYGDGVTVNGLAWLSNTKLLVALQAYTSGSANAANGFYIFDISATAVPAGVDDVSCNAFAAAPEQTGFQHVTTKPLAAAFKP
jgi:hypothetical protein